MEKGLALELRQASDAALGQHFIGHGRVGHIGLALAETAFDALLPAAFVHFLCKLPCHHGGKVACMLAVATAHEHFAHVGVHVVDAGDAGREKASAPHHDVDVLAGHVVVVKEFDGGVVPHRELVGEIGNLLYFGFGMVDVSQALQVAVYVVAELA